MENYWVNLRDVLKMANEYKDQIKIPQDKIGIYPIDKEQVNKILENIDLHSCLNDEDKKDSKNFLKRIIEIFRYVSFNEYLCIIRKISQEIKEFLLNNHNNYSSIYFTGLGPISKSYTWVLFLFLNELNDFFINNNEIMNKIKVGDYHKYETDILSKKLDKNNLYYQVIEKPIDNKRILFLYFDDMSYSGTQIANTIVDSKMCDIENICDYYLTCVFISETALTKIQNEINSYCHNFKIKYWNNIQIIPTLEKQFYYNIPDNEKSYYKKIYEKICNSYENNKFMGFGCFESHTPIYFDHKIADFMSTLDKLLYFGSYPINTDCIESKCIRTPLLKKCIENNTIIEKDINFCNNFYMGVNEEMECPKTFYKQINYKYDKESSIIDIINQTYKNNSNYKKYLKYKTKYINLKNSIISK
jgi:hypothetical protein